MTSFLQQIQHEKDEDEIWNVFNDYDKNCGNCGNYEIQGNGGNGGNEQDTNVNNENNENNQCVHGNYIFDPTSSSQICGNCGIILQSRMINHEPEWRNMKSNNQYTSDPIRCATVSNLLPTSSLSTKKRK